MEEPTTANETPEEKELREQLQRQAEAATAEAKAAAEANAAGSRASTSSRVSRQSAAAVARKKLAARRAAQKRTRKAADTSKREEEEPPSEVVPGFDFTVEGFGTLYAWFLQGLCKQLLQKRQFDAAQKAKIIEIADAYARRRFGDVAWLVEFMPEVALIGATVQLIVETPRSGTADHAHLRHTGDGQDDTSRGADAERIPAGDNGSHES